MWAEAGSPNNKEEVLTLRKRIMKALEEKGIKRTTSSAQLGNWHKERVPFKACIIRLRLLYLVHRSVR